MFSVHMCMCVHVLMCACKQRATSAISTWVASMLFSEMASLTCPEFTNYCREQKSWDGAFWPLGRRNYSTPPPSQHVCYIQKGDYGIQLVRGRGVIHRYIRRQRLWYTASGRLI